MVLKNYYTMTDNEKKLFTDFLIKCSKETNKPAHYNMYSVDWENKPNTLYFILNKTERFSINGSFNVLFNNNNILGCSGCYISEFCKDIAILGSRTWIHKDYRNRLIARDYFLPYEKNWALTNNIKCIILTFNNYNKNLEKIWNRRRFGELRTTRLPKHFGYNGVHVLEFPVIIQHTLQYVIYELLDPHFIFDWTTIKA